MISPNEYVRQAATSLGMLPERLRLYIHTDVFGKQVQREIGDSWTSWCEAYQIEENKGLYSELRVELQLYIDRGLPWWQPIHTFKLSPFPDCCGVLISHGVYTYRMYQNRGLNNLFNRARRELAAEFGYSALICTDVEQNVAERKTLRGAGFLDVFRFNNSRTKNYVLLSAINIEAK